MLSETFVTSIRAQQRSSNTTIAKDIGIHLHTLHPNYALKSTFKKSSTSPNGLAVSSSHIFAAQAEKAVVHVYSRDRGNQESLISFPERIHSIVLVNDGLLALGTAEGRIILWELFTGRQISTPTSHLQPVSCLAASSQHLISGSQDSNVHVWAISALLSLGSTELHKPVQSLSNHRAAITALTIGHSPTNTNICISASNDNTCLVWNYYTGEVLRTLLLPSTPLCVILDPCDREFYIGFENGSVRSVELYTPTTVINSLYDKTLQSTPVQISNDQFSGNFKGVEAALCLGLSYDGTTLLSGHASGKVIRWDTGSRNSVVELADVNAPVTNLAFISPFAGKRPVRAVNITKPKLGEGNYTVTAQLTGDLDEAVCDKSLHGPGFPSDVLSAMIVDFSSPVRTTSETDADLQKENEELWAIVNEQRELQKQTWSKYRKLQSGKVEG